MLHAKQFAFDLDGPLERYGCGWCGSDDIEPHSTADLRCRNCCEVTTPDRWCEWCSDHGIDVELGPFLQAVKNVKQRLGRPFEVDRARARYLGPHKAHVREDALNHFRILKEEYARLRSRHWRAIKPLEIEEL
jgi:hypothetical protein